MVEAYDKWRRWADEKVIRIITHLAVYDGDKVNNVDVDDGLDYHKNGAYIWLFMMLKISTMMTLIMMGRVFE